MHVKMFNDKFTGLGWSVRNWPVSAQDRLLVWAEAVGRGAGYGKIWEVQLGYLNNRGTKWWMDGSEREISKEKAPRWVTVTMRQKILECCLDFWLQPARSMVVLFNKIEKLG